MILLLLLISKDDNVGWDKFGVTKHMSTNGNFEALGDSVSGGDSEHCHWSVVVGHDKDVDKLNCIHVLMVVEVKEEWKEKCVVGNIGSEEWRTMSLFFIITEIVLLLVFMDLNIWFSFYTHLHMP